MNIDDSLWSKCGVRSVDHVAVTTCEMAKVLRDYLAIPGSELLRGPAVNTAQNVDFAFVRLATGVVVEILGLKEKSPITEHVKKGGGAYHMCFAVENLDYAVTAVQENGAIQVVKPREDDAFDGRRVAFFMHPDHGLFEFLEAYPEEFTAGNKTYATKRPDLKSKSVDSSNDAMQIIRQVFSRLFPELTDIDNAKYGITPGWTSFRHLQLFMEIEQLAGVSFTADEIAAIQDYAGLVKGLANKLED